MIITIEDLSLTSCVCEDDETLQEFCSKICEYSKENNCTVLAKYKDLYPLSVFPLSYVVDIETIFQLREQIVSNMKEYGH